MMNNRVFWGRVEWWARHYKGPKFHALLSDPPYHLTSITERYSKSGPTAANLKTTADQGCSPYARTASGFMGKQWDGGDIAFRPDTWTALTEHLYPGAFGMAFASSRGWHRMAVAIEDAKLIIHPSIFLWAYGSGFPKATRVPDERFDGHRYGLQAMKPAAEPIIVFQKPYEGRPVDNITQTGAGALNIDAARIAHDEPAEFMSPQAGNRIYGQYGNPDQELASPSPLGRWPANLVLDSEAARRLDVQSGELQSGSRDLIGHQKPQGVTSFGGADARPFVGDSGGASRFFFTHQEDQLQDVDPLYYCAKASASEREAGVERPHTTVNDGRQKSIDNAYQRGETLRRNTHPTIKPIDLTRWLATLLLPPKEYAPRRLLIPFSGAGSEMIGAMQAGWDDITGIEMTREYVEIARARLEFWSRIGVQLPLFEMEKSA